MFFFLSWLCWLLSSSLLADLNLCEDESALGSAASSSHLSPTPTFHAAHSLGPLCPFVTASRPYYFPHHSAALSSASALRLTTSQFFHLFLNCIYFFLFLHLQAETSALGKSLTPHRDAQGTVGISAVGKCLLEFVASERLPFPPPTAFIPKMKGRLCEIVGYTRPMPRYVPLL